MSFLLDGVEDGNQQCGESCKMGGFSSSLILVGFSFTGRLHSQRDTWGWTSVRLMSGLVLCTPCHIWLGLAGNWGPQAALLKPIMCREFCFWE